MYHFTFHSPLWPLQVLLITTVCAFLPTVSSFVASYIEMYDLVMSPLLMYICTFKMHWFSLLRIKPGSGNVSLHLSLHFFSSFFSSVAILYLYLFIGDVIQYHYAHLYLFITSYLCNAPISISIYICCYNINPHTLALEGYTYILPLTVPQPLSIIGLKKRCVFLLF